MVRKTWVQFQVESYQRLLKWYLIPPCLTLSDIRYVSRVKWSDPRIGVASSPTPRCSSYWKGSLLVTLDYGRQLYFLLYVKRNSPVPDAFAKVVKVTNYTWLGNAEFAWYFPSNTHPICFYDMELGIYGFKPTIHWVIVVLATWVKFLQFICLLCSDQLHLYLLHNKWFLIASSALWLSSNS